MHVLTLHGRVGLTMTYIRRDYWIPRLRRLTKKVICGCFGCKRSQAAAFRNPPPGNLQLNAPPVQFPSKSWIWTMPVQFHTRPVPREKGETPTSCCLHVVWPELCTLSFGGFIKSFKRFKTRRGRLQKVYSDNGRGFVAAVRWLWGLLWRMRGCMTTYPEMIISPGSLTSVEPLARVVSLRG